MNSSQWIGDEPCLRRATAGPSGDLLEITCVSDRVQNTHMEISEVDDAQMGDWTL